jgi:hypothetical protein
MPAVTAARKALPPPPFSDLGLPGLLMIGGVMLQVFWSGIIGLFLLMAGLSILHARTWNPDRGMSFTPHLNGGKTRWVSATQTEIDKLRKKMKAIESFGPGCLTTIGHFVLSLVILFALPVLVGVVSNALRSPYDGEYGLITFFDTLLVLFVYFWFFSPSLWKPALIDFKLPHFQSLLASLPELGMGTWQRDFQLELTASNKGDVPTDVKIVLRPPDCPREFLGVQGQISINRGGPYLYFVIITRPELEIIAPPQVGTDVFERKKGDEVNILVIRQHATNSGGYQTRPADVKRLLTSARQATERTLPGA